MLTLLEKIIRLILHKNCKGRTMNEMIEKLKDKNYVRAFGLMTPEEQECLRKVGIKNCEAYKRDGDWGQAYGDALHQFDKECTYAIKPDYKPEPEFVDLEIVNSNGALLVIPMHSQGRYDSFLSGPTRIHKLPSLPNFECFWWDNNGARWNLAIVYVAKNIDKGHKVYARFRK